MPELPEVETIKNDLKQAILGKKITQVTVKDEKIVKNQSAEFVKILKGNRIEDLSRIGKLLIFKLGREELYLLIHLKMTGQLVFVAGDRIIAGGHQDQRSKTSFFSEIEAEGKHTRIIFEFSNGAKLFFNDLRRFGYAKIVNAEELKIVAGAYGPEPLSKVFTKEALGITLKGKKAPVKAILLNQGLIAGIGNIYADEALFAAKIRPDRKAESLTSEEVKRLAEAIKMILKKAIKFRGTTFSNYRDASGRKGNFSRLLKVYGKDGEICPCCRKTKLKKIKVAGRGTVVCENCQK